MNSDVVWLDQIMSILLAMSKFCFAQAEHNLIKFKLYNNWSAQAVELLCVMWNSSKPIKFAHL